MELYGTEEGVEIDSQTVLAGRMLSLVVWGISWDFLTVMQWTLKMIISRIINKNALPADPWCDSSFETKAYVRALQLYRQDKGCYESWEMLLGTKEKVSKHTDTHTHMHARRRLHFSFQSVAPCPPTDDPVFVCVGAGLPGDAGSVAMVTESASIKSEGQEDWEDTAVVGSEFN